MFWILLLNALFSVEGQNIGKQTQNQFVKMTIEKCTKSNGCTPESPGSVTIDANWRWDHKTGSPTNCYTGNKWDPTFCPDWQTCTKNCAVDGVDSQTWQGTYGITSIEGGKGVQLGFVTHGPYSVNIGSRLYYMDTQKTYKKFMLLNQEFTFDVDVSDLDCGLNGALYFVEMDADGGLSKYSTNLAGAPFGTGYCDAQCPHDLKWINGEANIIDWKPSDNDPNSGTGHYGTCCAEMDIWESNKQATAYTPHPCKTQGQHRCEGTECGDIDTHERYKGVCDKDGCDLNAYRSGNHTFYGPGSSFVVDSSKPITVVTQFITSDGTNAGDLKEIKRLWVQNGKVIKNAMTNLPSMTTQYNSISDEMCAAQKKAMGDTNSFMTQGGMKGMGEAMSRGMVLVMSLWDDHYAHMLWLDSAYPLDKPVTQPGVLRGPCSTDSGKPADVESKQANAHVKYYNVRYGDLDSTYNN